MRQFILIAFYIFALSNVVSAAETVTTTDGRQIRLGDNGTYEILKPESKLGYTPVDIVDLYMESKKWDGRKVLVRGKVSANIKASDAELFLRPGSSDITFTIVNKGVAKATRRKMLKECRIWCHLVEVSGTLVRFHPYKRGKTIEAHEIKIIQASEY